jgi:hypothetical protein
MTVNSQGPSTPLFCDAFAPTGFDRYHQEKIAEERE